MKPVFYGRHTLKDRGQMPRTAKKDKMPLNDGQLKMIFVIHRLQKTDYLTLGKIGRSPKAETHHRCGRSKTPQAKTLR